jgi:hypothetical protein
MPKPTLLSATYRATTYTNSRKGVAFPKALYKAFGFKGQDKVSLIVRTLEGKTLFRGTSRFISGPEITVAETCRKFEPSQEVQVTASRPK